MEVGHDRREKVDTRPEGVEEALRVVVRATMKGIDTALSIEAYINDMRYVCEGSLYQVNKYSNGPSLLPSKAEHPVAWSSPRTTHQSRGRAGETWPCASRAVMCRHPPGAASLPAPYFMEHTQHGYSGWLSDSVYPSFFTTLTLIFPPYPHCENQPCP